MENENKEKNEKNEKGIQLQMLITEGKNPRGIPSSAFIVSSIEKKG
jgi:hypothetical protein